MTPNKYFTTSCYFCSIVIVVSVGPEHPARMDPSSRPLVIDKLAILIPEKNERKLNEFIQTHEESIREIRPINPVLKNYHLLQRSSLVMLSSIFGWNIPAKPAKVRSNINLILIAFCIMNVFPVNGEVNIQQDEDHISIMTPVSKMDTYSLVENHGLDRLTNLENDINKLQENVLSFMDYNNSNRYCSLYVNDDYPDEFNVIKGISSRNKTPYVFSHVEQVTPHLYQSYMIGGKCRYRFSNTFAESIGVTNMYTYATYKSQYKYKYIPKYYHTFPKKCVMGGFIEDQKPYKIDYMYATGIVGCKTLCSSEKQCNTIEWDPVEQCCRLFDSRMIKITRTKILKDYFRDLAKVVMPNDCNFVRTMDIIPMIQMNGKLELLQDHCQFEDSSFRTYQRNDFQFRCTPFYSTKYKVLKNLKMKLKDFKNLLLLNYQISSENRQKRGAGLAKLIFNIALKVGKNFNKIFSITELIKNKGPWSIMKLKEFIINEGYVTSLSSDLTYFPLLSLESPQILNFQPIIKEIQNFEFDFHSVQKQVDDVIRYFRSVIEYNQPMNVKLNTTEFLYSRYVDEDKISRTFIFSNYTTSHQKMIIKVPTGNDFFDLNQWADNVDILNITSSCSEYEDYRPKRSVDTYNCRKNAILKNRISENLITIRLFDKIFNGFLIIINEKSLVQFICKDSVVTYSNMGFSIYITGLNCDVYLYNNKIVTALQFESSLKPKQLFSGPLISMNKFTKALDSLLTFHINNFNDIVQYIMLFLLLLCFIYTNCYTLLCGSGNKTQGDEIHELCPENQNLMSEDQEMQLVRNVSSQNPV